MQNHLKAEEEQRPPEEASRLPSGHTSAGRGWLRYAIPSSADLVFMVLLAGLSTGPLATALLGDGGTGWHIRTGEWILKAHAIPRVDLFSTTMQGKPWYAWEWLYDVVVGTLHSAVGLNGVVLMTAIVIALTFALLLKSVLARAATLPVAVALLLLAFTASTIHFLARPHVLSWLFALVWCEALERFETDGNTRALLWLPLLMIVWVNVHGGFLVGLMALAIYFSSDLASAVLSAGTVAGADPLARARKLAGSGFAAALGTLLNPYGYRLYWHIFKYLSDHFLMHHIEEFFAPSFQNVAQRCFAALILVAIATMIVSRRHLPLRHWLMLLFAIASGLYAVRNIPVSSILIVWIAAPQLSMSLHENAEARQSRGMRTFTSRLESFGFRMTRFEQTLHGHFWPALATLGAIALCLSGGSLAGHTVMSAQFDGKRFPIQTADYLAAHVDSQPVFTMDRWGGYLIYRFYPKVLVAVDDRHDLYGADFLKNYLKIIHGDAGWESALENLHPGWALVPADGPLAGLLRHNKHWRSAYRDDRSELFERSR